VKTQYGGIRWQLSDVVMEKEFFQRLDVMSHNYLLVRDYKAHLNLSTEDMISQWCRRNYDK